MGFSFLSVSTGKPNLRLSISPIPPLIHDESSPSPFQSPRSASSPEQTLSPSHSTQSDHFLWPDVQELRTKYTKSQSSKLSCTAPNGMLKFSTSRCQGCPNHYNSLLDLHRAAADCQRTDTLPKQSCGEEDSQHRPHPPLCRWSSLDHVLGSLPLHEVQNLQEPASLAGENRTVHEEEALQEGSDCATKSKLAESHLVKSLREKFQSLSASS